ADGVVLDLGAAGRGARLGVLAAPLGLGGVERPQRAAGGRGAGDGERRAGESALAQQQYEVREGDGGSEAEGAPGPSAHAGVLSEPGEARSWAATRVSAAASIRPRHRAPQDGKLPIFRPVPARTIAAERYGGGMRGNAGGDPGAATQTRRWPP